MWLPEKWPVGLEFGKSAYFDEIHGKIICILGEESHDEKVRVELDGKEKSVRDWKESGSKEVYELCCAEDEVLKDILRELLKECFEIWRLSELRQAGLSYIVRYVDEYDHKKRVGKSEDEAKASAERAAILASYTRLTHSAGVLYLGDTALREVSVVAGGPFKKLREFLEESKYGGSEDGIMLLREFMLALFLHDIGHFPFSHILESSSGFEKFGLNDKVVGVDLILGGNFCHVLEEIVRTVAQECCDVPSKMVYEILGKYEKDNVICRNCIAALIYPEAKVPSCHCAHRDKPIFKALQDLTSSLVDLDRLDHYLRDDHYLKLGVLGEGVMKLIKSIKIDPKTWGVYLEEDDIPTAIQLLVAKEVIWLSQLDTDRIRFCESVLNRAVDALIEDCGFTVFDIMFLTDKLLNSVLIDYEDKSDWVRLCNEILDPTNGSSRDRIRRMTAFYITKADIPQERLKSVCEGDEFNGFINELKGRYPKAVDMKLYYWHGKYTQSPWINIPIRTRKGDVVVLNDIPRHHTLCHGIRHEEEYGRQITRIFLLAPKLELLDPQEVRRYSEMIYDLEGYLKERLPSAIWGYGEVQWGGV